VGVACVGGTGTAGVAADALSSSFARVELFLQPATNSGRISKSGRIRRNIPVTKRLDYHDLKEITSDGVVSLCNGPKAVPPTPTPTPAVESTPAPSPEVIEDLPAPNVR
jgi:hypothetical protein